MFLEVFGVLGPFTILKDCYVYTKKLWPLTFFVLSLIWLLGIITTPGSFWSSSYLSSVYNREKLLASVVIVSPYILPVL